MKKKTGIFLEAALLSGGFCLQNGYKAVFANAYEACKNGAIICQADEDVLVGKSVDDLKIRAKSCYLMDFGSKTQIYAQNETKRLPIASMCKIMTLLLCFEAIDNGVLDMDSMIKVSETAASMGGSQVFLEAHADYPVKELIKSIVVCSANDSCVAMAEEIAGSESVFVDKMNEKARALGAENTLFANCTGLPKEPQYSCAKDVALMLKALLEHEEYYEFGSVWMDKFEHPKGRYTEISNTNRLVRFYEGCDGGKTGFTNQAGFCLAATAKRKDMRVISVVIGEENSNNRFEDTKTMFNYAFANYQAVPVIEEGKPLENPVSVSGGKSESVCIAPKYSLFAFKKRDEQINVNIKLHLYDLKAPLCKGAEVGKITVYVDGVEYDCVPLVALDDIQKASVWDSIVKIARAWNARF